MNTVILRDNQTTEIKEIDTEFSEFWWEEGNGSCDCNMGSSFYPGEDFKCGDTRFKLMGFKE